MDEDKREQAKRSRPGVLSSGVEREVTMDVFEAIYTLRAMRRLKPDPVDEALVWKVLDAAIRAPSGGNLQPWAFVVVTDPAKKAKIGEWYLDGWNQTYGNRPLPPADTPAGRTMRSADHLAHNIASVPVLIFACIQSSRVASVSGVGPNIYPAVQNLMLAARAEGLGTTLTTLHRAHEAEVRELLGVPEDFETMAMIPMGWPKGKFGSGPRRPVEDVTYWDTWGSTKSR
jgi:nitroreductase